MQRYDATRGKRVPKEVEPFKLCARNSARSDFATWHDGHGPCMRGDSQFPGAGVALEVNDDGVRKAQVPGTPWFEPVKGG